MNSDYQRAYQLQYREKNKEKLKLYQKEYQKSYRTTAKEYYKIYGKKYREVHKEQAKAYQKLNREKYLDPSKNSSYQKQHGKKYRERPEAKEKAIAYRKYYRELNESYFRDYFKNKRINSVQFRIACNLRVRLYSALKGKAKNGSAVRDVGCTMSFLKERLELMFQQGMTWGNYGLLTWHIDHIIPLASFDLTDREQLLKACHYSNLQPMWAKDNWSKGDKIMGEKRIRESGTSPNKFPILRSGVKLTIL